MRILVACELFHPSVGGVQEVVRQVAERLVERGHRVTVVTSQLRERTTRDLNGISIKEFRVSGNLARGLWGDVGAYREYVLAGDYDVLLIKAAQQWTFDALVPVLGRIARPKVFIPCGFSGLFEPEYADYYRAMPEWLRAFDHLIFYASRYRDIDFARAHGIDSYSIVPNGASEREFQIGRDKEFRARHGIPQDAFVVLTVGSLTGEKGHRELAEAFLALRPAGRPWFLILNGNRIGPSGWRDRFERLPAQAVSRYKAAGAWGVAKWFLRPLLVRARLVWLLQALGYRVEPQLQPLVARINREAPRKRALLVNLPRRELLQAYLNSDLFVFASNIEYSPLVLFEAAAAGLPFLSVPVGNAEEIARWTGGGEICAAPFDEKGYTRADPSVLSRHIEVLSSDSVRLSAYRDVGRRSWLERFTWEKITDRYEEILSGLVSGTRSDTDASTRSLAARPVPGR